MLKLHLGQIDSLEKAIAEIEGGWGRLEPFREKSKRLMTIPGVSDWWRR